MSEEMPHVPVHLGSISADAAAALGATTQPPVRGYVRSTWKIETVPLAAAGVKPVQLLQSDERRDRAVIISIDQDMFLASTEAELLQGPSQAAPQGGYWPKGVPLELKDSDPLYALSAVSGTTRVTVHAESTT